LFIVKDVQSAAVKCPATDVVAAGILYNRRRSGRSTGLVVVTPQFLRLQYIQQGLLQQGVNPKLACFPLNVDQSAELLSAPLLTASCREFIKVPTGVASYISVLYNLLSIECNK
jgi:hypothetical protein